VPGEIFEEKIAQEEATAKRVREQRAQTGNNSEVVSRRDLAQGGIQESKGEDSLPLQDASITLEDFKQATAGLDQQERVILQQREGKWELTRAEEVFLEQEAIKHSNYQIAQSLKKLLTAEESGLTLAENSKEPITVGEINGVIERVRE